MYTICSKCALKGSQGGCLEGHGGSRSGWGPCVWALDGSAWALPGQPALPQSGRLRGVGSQGPQARGRGGRTLHGMPTTLRRGLRVGVGGWSADIWAPPRHTAANGCFVVHCGSYVLACDPATRGQVGVHLNPCI